MAEETNPNVAPNETNPEGGAQSEETVSKKQYYPTIQAKIHQTVHS